jgi:hypothetical protein
MNPNVYQLLATERIAGYHREADQRRLADAATRRPRRPATARPMGSGRARSESNPA